MTRILQRWICLAWLLLVPFPGNAATPMVSLGQEHALALRSDGTVVAWGSDQFGKLGTGRSLDVPTPTTVPGLTAMRAIGGGRYHSLAIGQDGSLWTWGSNSRGQLGDGTSTDRTSPVQVPGIENSVMACGGAYYSVVLKQDGTLWAWGDLLGPQFSLIPVQFVGLTGVTSVACGFEHFIALRQDGTVWGWGGNSQGALGDGTTNTRLQPVQVPGLGNVVAVGAGFNYSAALKQDGTVWEWGLVNSTGAVRLSPVQSVGISGAVKMRAGDAAIAAIKADGTTWWFWESGTTPAIQNPVGSLESVVPAGTTTLLLKSDRTVMLAHRTPPLPLSPAPVAGLSNIVAIAGGQEHSLALDADGIVWAGGSDSNGQLGLGANLSSSIPVEISGLGNIVQVSTSFNHNLAVDQDGNVWAWGDNQGAQLGDGTSTARSAPVRLTSIANVQAVAAGNLYSLALKRDGTVWAWGSNYSGVFGNGTNSNSGAPSPVQVPGLAGVVAIAAGASHSLALKQDGSVWAWGANDVGQLGSGTVIPSSLPAQIPGLSGVRSVAASSYNSYAVKADGTAMAWGRNQYGTVGDGSTTDRHSPVSVTGLTAVVEIAAGAEHVLARRADGSVWGWGTGTSGELGLNQNPLLPLRTTSAPIGSISAIQQISAGDFVSGFVRQDGLVQMGGRNRTGQSGDGTYAEHQSFVLVVNTSVNGFLNLYPGTVASVPTNLNVPFFLATYKSGGLSALTLSADIRGITAIGAFAAASGVGPLAAGGYNISPEKIPQFFLASYKSGDLSAPSLSADTGGITSGGIFASATDFANPLVNALAAGGYNVYVAASVPTSGYFQLDSSNRWSVLIWPMAEFIRGVALGSQDAVIRVNILQNVDVSPYIGTSILVGYGTSPDEMRSNSRYRTIFTVPAQ